MEDIDLKNTHDMLPDSNLHHILCRHGGILTVYCKLSVQHQPQYISQEYQRVH